MGRSSCFKIIACGGGGGGGNSESVDRDALDTSPQNNGSDKRGWSFRKKSSGHRVLSNTVITEISSSENKSSEPIGITSEAPVSSSVSEKTSVNPWIEELPRASTSTTKCSTVPKTNATDDVHIETDSAIDESFVIVIQAAVRKYLAQLELVRHKKAVVLQAAVRGHLVRCRAAGSLRCVQAIVKMQTLVRARRTNLSVGNGKKKNQDSTTRTQPTYISIEKLLSNRFAIQLLESTPRTKPINIKCAPSKDDSSWKWMERWMSVSSPEVIDSHLINPMKDKIDDIKSQVDNVINEQKSDLFPDESKRSSIAPKIESNLLPEQSKRPSKRGATEQADSEGRKTVFGSRKPSNPSFIAAHSRFEELTSKTTSLTSVKSSNQEHLVDSRADKSTKLEPAEAFVYESLKVGRSQTGDSECGTELSITSMLDSPDPSEVGNTENDKESKVVDKVKVTSNEEHDLLGTELTHSILTLPEQYDFSSNEQNTNISQSKQNGSPKSQITVPESQTTPSSQLSIKNKTKTDKKVSGQKPKSWSNSVKSPVSFDHLPRESKPGKRRNSFGSQTSEHIDQEPRDSSSSNSIPSYMQVTESARAKALANNSPRSSPDLHGKEAYLKKRHSLPGAVNGRHDSPRTKRSSPQAQQTTKGNDNRERKWQK
ncbi:protein IQ-DOMAIN 32-like [Rutidosis leptorrhynchoides]|uniref:protein IQ-DOMAIN 32-like n=1 Tax=Rutidosis leptorrhynchoides TaxID=125765 RepID=UPI003A9A5CBA